MKTPRPVQIITVSITPRIRGDHRLIHALDRLAVEDLAIRIAWSDSETGRVTVAGVGETHLEVVIDRLRKEFGIEGTVSPPGVFLKRAISESAVGESKYRKMAGGKGQYAHVKLQLTPQGDGEGYSFENQLLAGMLPERFIWAIEQGIESTRTIGYPFDDVKVELVDGSYHDVDSSDSAFRIAAGDAFWDAALRAKPTVVAPVMRLKLAFPIKRAAEVMRKLFERGAQIVDEQEEDDRRTVVALVRVPQIFGLTTALGQIISDVGASVMWFDHYESISPQLGEPLPWDLDLDGNDRDSLVGAPRKPATPNRLSAVALPEPEEQEDDEDDDWPLQLG